MEMKFVPKG